MTHARFVGSDQASDGVVLMKIVQVLRTLMLSPEGSALTNESVCEVMLSCFRICFEPRLNELLRRAAEHALKDIIHLLFMRLPQFAEERHGSGLIKKLKMIANGGGIETSSKRRRSSKNSGKISVQGSSKTVSNAPKSVLTAPTIRCPEGDELNSPKSSTETDNSSMLAAATPNQSLLNVQKSILATTPSTPHVGNIVDMQGKFMQTPNIDNENKGKPSRLAISKGETNDDVPSSHSTDGTIEENAENDADVEDDANDDQTVKAQNTSTNADQSVESKDENASTSLDANPIVKGEDFVNSMGVRFTPQTENGAFFSKYKNFNFCVVFSLLFVCLFVCLSVYLPFELLLVL